MRYGECWSGEHTWDGLGSTHAQEMAEQNKQKTEEVMASLATLVMGLKKIRDQYDTVLVKCSIKRAKL